MVRPLRIKYEGAWYHVMNRGLEFRNIFLNKKHKKLFLDLLSEISERFKIDIHSYCLMDNHYHLLLQSKLPNLNLAMKHLNGVYTSRFNRDIKRDGPIFRGRYKSILIEKENYLLNVSRYIHKNPSAAKITDDDQKYLWSSYQYYILNKSNAPKWLIKNEILGYFDGNGEEYKRFVEDEIDENTKEFYSSEKLKPILGNKLFIKKISSKFLSNDVSKEISSKNQITSIRYPSLEELLFKVVEKCQIKSDLILQNYARNFVFERNLLIYLFMLNPRYSLVEKGKFLGVSGEAISISYKRFLNKFKLDKEMAKVVESIRREIYVES
jgi:REP element-mobilizing transposase RayT